MQDRGAEHAVPEGQRVTERLEDGWQPDTPEGDTIVHAFAAGFARWMLDLGAALGGRTLDDPMVSALDTGSDFFLANGAVLKRPFREAELAGVVARLREFYAEVAGGPWALFSPFPLSDPTAVGLHLEGHPPLMARAPSGIAAPPDPPAGIEIVKAHDVRTVEGFAEALAGYPAPDTRVFANPALLDLPGTHVFVAYEGDRPVACAAAHTTEACVHVDFVAAHEDVRGRGIGEAVTWRATLADPTKPAVLIASDPGQPVYERMGYLRITRFTCWTGGRT